MCSSHSARNTLYVMQSRNNSQIHKRHPRNTTIKQTQILCHPLISNLYTCLSVEMFTLWGKFQDAELPLPHNALVSLLPLEWDKTCYSFTLFPTSLPCVLETVLTLSQLRFHNCFGVWPIYTSFRLCPVWRHLIGRFHFFLIQRPAVDITSFPVC